MNLNDYNHILIFGGSFDPPHHAHIQLPQHVKKTIDADAILYIPAGNAPHKQHLKKMPAHHRLAMTQLAIANTPDCFISEIEINWPNNTPTYTAETLKKLREEVSSKTKLTFLIGADMMRIFYKWHKPQQVLDAAEIAVMVRPPDTKQALLDSLPSHADKQQWNTRLIPTPQMDISSTQIRKCIQQNQTTEKFLDSNVRDYIDKHQLYRS